MSYTKKQFITMAFEEIGMGGNFDLQPGQYQAALRRLDGMIASWNARGIRIAYPMNLSPENSDIDVETNVPDKANEAVYTNLAVRICSVFGKVVPPELNNRADELYKNLLTSTFNLEEVDIMGLPTGAGSKWWSYADQRFIDQSRTSDIDTGADGILEFQE